MLPARDAYPEYDDDQYVFVRAPKRIRRDEVLMGLGGAIAVRYCRLYFSLSVIRHIALQLPSREPPSTADVLGISRHRLGISSANISMLTRRAMQPERGINDVIWREIWKRARTRNWDVFHEEWPGSNNAGPR